MDEKQMNFLAEQGNESRYIKFGDYSQSLYNQWKKNYTSIPIFILGHIFYIQRIRDWLRLEGDHWRPSAPSHCSSRATESQLFRTASRIHFKIPKDGDSGTFWATCATAQSPPQFKKVFCHPLSITHGCNFGTERVFSSKVWTVVKKYFSCKI